MIVAGLPAAAPLSPAALGLFRGALLPLHRPNKFFEWRDQLPLLQTYHAPLVKCLLLFLARDPSLLGVLGEVVAEMVQVWPEGYDANTAKEASAPDPEPFPFNISTSPPITQTLTMTYLIVTFTVTS